MLSVLICTYGRYDHAIACVQDLSISITSCGADVEVIVVDNTPVEQRILLPVPTHVNVVACDTPGLSHARNAGIMASTGDIIAFLDDDARVSEGWVAAVLDAFDSHSDIAACGGRTVADYQGHPLPAWYYPELDRHLSCIDWDSVPRPLKRNEWIVGANMAFRRKVFDKHGFFDPSLGRKGDATLLSNEETALIKAIGLENIYYVPDMEVRHLVPAERLTSAWLRKRVVWQAMSNAISGEGWMSPEKAWETVWTTAGSLPVEARGFRALAFEPRTPEEMRKQLGILFSLTTAMMHGMPVDIR